MKNAQQSAIGYERLLSRKGMRANELRFHVLEILSGATEFIDVKMLAERLEEKGISADNEKVRYVIKIISAAGFLEKKPVEKMNKYLFRLYPLEMLEKQFSIR